MEPGTRSTETLPPTPAACVILRPTLKLNQRRLGAIPLGAVLGAGAGFATAAVYQRGAPAPQIAGGMIALWIWLQVCVGPLLLTVLYADNTWAGERGLWKRRGGRVDQLAYIIRKRNSPVFIWDPSGCRQPQHYHSISPRLRWSREQLAALASFLNVPTYGIWPAPGQCEPLQDCATDPVPVPHLESFDDVGNAIGAQL